MSNDHSSMPHTIVAIATVINYESVSLCACIYSSVCALLLMLAANPFLLIGTELIIVSVASLLSLVWGAI